VGSQAWKASKCWTDSAGIWLSAVLLLTVLNCMAVDSRDRADFLSTLLHDTASAAPLEAASSSTTTTAQRMLINSYTISCSRDAQCYAGSSMLSEELLDELKRWRGSEAHSDQSCERSDPGTAVYRNRNTRATLSCETPVTMDKATCMQGLRVPPVSNWGVLR
jgi:hypothetical protein